MSRRLAVFLSLFILLAVCRHVSAEGPVVPTGKEKCPVCGMFTKMYPKWATQIVFKDGGYEIFDGPKDAFKYYFNMAKYSKNRTKEDVSAIWATEYYSAKPMRAEKLYFVLGSDVMGPMGAELIPLEDEKKAKEFMLDHRGEKILKFSEISADDIPR